MEPVAPGSGLVAFRLLYLITIRVFGWHADLGAVAVGDEELVVAQNRGECRDGAGDVCFLDTGIG